MSESDCTHDARFGLFGLPKEVNGCLACAYEQQCARVAELEEELMANSTRAPSK